MGEKEFLVVGAVVLAGSIGWKGCDEVFREDIIEEWKICIE